MSYTALIIDDEPHARSELRYLLESAGLFDIKGEAGNAVDGIKLVNTHKPDIIFLDISMPLLNGFEMLSMIEKSIMPYVVFVTAYDQYAIKAFEEKALDYLLKPVEESRFSKTMEKITASLKTGEKPEYERTELTRIPCRLNNTIKFIDAKDIEFIRSDMTGVHIVTSEGEYLTDLTLKVIECRTELERCHRQYIINISQIDRISINDNLSGRIFTRSGKEIIVSRRYLKTMREKLGI